MTDSEKALELVLNMEDVVKDDRYSDEYVGNCLRAWWKEIYEKPGREGLSE